VALGLAQWAKKRQEDDISALKGVEERYLQIFEKVDEQVISAFKEASFNMYEEMFRFTLHTLISGAKANIFS
jgi:plasmid replication initiation protein